MHPYTPSNTSFNSTITNFDTTDVVQGGVSGTDNVPLKELADNDAYLYDRLQRYSAVTDKTFATGTLSLTLTRTEYLNNIVRCKFNNNVRGTLTLPNIADAAIGDKITIFCQSPSFPRANVKIQGDSSIQDHAGGRSKVYLYHGESVTLVKVTASTSQGWQILSTQGNALKAGQQQYGYYQEAGTLVRDGSIVDRADYPRLWELVNSLSGFVISDATWTSSSDNRGYFSSGDGSTTFRLPDDRGTFERALDLAANVDTDRNGGGLGSKAGSYQADELRSHNHNDTNTASGTGGSGKVVIGNTGSGGLYGTGYTGGSETRPKNVGKYPLIVY